MEQEYMMSRWGFDAAQAQIIANATEVLRESEDEAVNAEKLMEVIRDQAPLMLFDLELRVGSLTDSEVRAIVFSGTV